MPRFPPLSVTVYKLIVLCFSCAHNNFPFFSVYPNSYLTRKFLNIWRIWVWQTRETLTTFKFKLCTRTIWWWISDSLSYSSFSQSLKTFLGPKCSVNTSLTSPYKSSYFTYLLTRNKPNPMCVSLAPSVKQRHPSLDIINWTVLFTVILWNYTVTRKHESDTCDTVWQWHSLQEWLYLQGVAKK